MQICEHAQGLFRQRKINLIGDNGYSILMDCCAVATCLPIFVFENLTRLLKGIYIEQGDNDVTM